MIDLNETNYERSTIKAFNDGRAGIVEVEIIEISSNEEAGYWRIVFADSNGSELHDYQNYLDSNHPNFENMLRAQGISLRHYWEVIVGEEKIPSFEGPREMLNDMMSKLSQNVEGKLFRLAVDYGIGEYHYRFLRRKRYVPFIENASKEPSSLTLSAGAYTKPSTEEGGQRNYDKTESDSQKKPSEGENFLDD